MPKTINPEPETPATPQTYSAIVNGTLQHGYTPADVKRFGLDPEEHLLPDDKGNLVYPKLREYQHGETFETPDAALFATLRKQGALKLPEELKTPEEMAAENAVALAERDQMAARIAELEAQLAAAQQSGKKQF